MSRISLLLNGRLRDRGVIAISACMAFISPVFDHIIVLSILATAFDHI